MDLATPFQVRLTLSLAPLPTGLQASIDDIAAVLQDPAGWVVYQALSQLDSALGLNVLSWTGPAGTDPQLHRAAFDEVEAYPDRFPFWQRYRTAQVAAMSQRHPAEYAALLDAAPHLAQALSTFDVGSTWHVAVDAAGTTLVKEPHDLVFTWWVACNTGDQGCARRPLYNDTSLAGSATTDAAVVQPGTGPGQEHTVSVSQDAATLPHVSSMIGRGLHGVVLPGLPAPYAGATMHDVMLAIQECVAFGASLASDPQVGSLLSASTGRSLCETGVAAGTATLDSNFEGSVAGDTPLSLQPSFTLSDTDLDGHADTMADVKADATWDAAAPSPTQLGLQPGTARPVNVPCVRDADCAAGLFCQPLAHYLAVRAVELVCAPPRGTDPYGTLSAAASTCETGLRVSTPAGAACTVLCAVDGDCPTGTCAAMAAYALEGDTPGLGSVDVTVCMP